MSWQMQLNDGQYTPADTLIPGNSESTTPVRFHLLPAKDADKARLKSIMVATSGLITIDDWTPRIQDMVIRAFQTSGDLFTRTVERVEGLTIPAKFARINMLAPPAELEKYPNPKDKFPITTGGQFAQVAGYHTALALAVAFEIHKLTGEADGVDSRLFQQPSGSSPTETPASQNGTARGAKKRRGKHVTAGSK